MSKRAISSRNICIYSRFQHTRAREGQRRNSLGRRQSLFIPTARLWFVFRATLSSCNHTSWHNALLLTSTRSLSRLRLELDSNIRRNDFINGRNLKSKDKNFAHRQTSGLLIQLCTTWSAPLTSALNRL